MPLSDTHRHLFPVNVLSGTERKAAEFRRFCYDPVICTPWSPIVALRAKVSNLGVAGMTETIAIPRLWERRSPPSAREVCDGPSDRD
jgi:hypothetical protein